MPALFTNASIFLSSRFEIFSRSLAFQWLMKNGFPQYAALDMAIVNDKKAFEWLDKYKFHFLIVLANASQGKKDAIRWLAMHDLQIFIRISKKIKTFTDAQTFDYHKLHF